MNLLSKHILFFGSCFIAILFFIWQRIDQNLLNLTLWLPLLIWLVGYVLGFLTLNLDQLWDVYFVNPKTHLATVVKENIKKGKISQAMRLLLVNKHLQARLGFHSSLFQVIWAGLTLFTLTSTASLFGKAFILGLGNHLILEQWQSYEKNRDQLMHRLFWFIKQPVSDQQLKSYLFIMTVLCVVYFFSSLP